MARKVRIALTFDLDNPIHEKAYFLLSKLNRIHSEFIANITYNFLTQNYNGDISKISKADARMLALCAKYCCNDESYDFTNDPRILGQLLMLLNQNLIISGSDVDNVIHQALANMNIFTGQAGSASTTTQNVQIQHAAPTNASPDCVPADEEMPVKSQSFPQQSSSVIPGSASINDSAHESEDIIEDDLDQEEPIEVNEAALRAFNNMHLM